MLGQQPHEKDQSDLTPRGSELPTSSPASPPFPTHIHSRTSRELNAPMLAIPFLGPRVAHDPVMWSWSWQTHPLGPRGRSLVFIEHHQKFLLK